MRRLAVSCLVAGLLLPQPGRAADSEGAFAVKGAGSVTCGELIGALEENSQRGLLLLGWVEGYVSAANQFVEGVFDFTPWQRAEMTSDLLVNLCDGNRDQAVFRVMGRLLTAMEPSRLDQRSEVETIPAGESVQFEIYRETLKQAQERLIELGHLDGGADGRYGPKTAAAISDFQRAAGVQINSLPDQETLFALFADSFNAN